MLKPYLIIKEESLIIKMKIKELTILSHVLDGELKTVNLTGLSETLGENIGEN